VGLLARSRQKLRQALQDRGADAAALMDKMLATMKFNQGYATTEYLEATLLDQAWHEFKPDQVPSDVAGFERATLHRYGVDFAPVRHGTGALFLPLFLRRIRGQLLSISG